MAEMKLFEEQPCPECGVRFGVPAGYEAKRRMDQRKFYCPNGHSMSFRESEADQLRRERDRLKQEAARLVDEASRQRQLREMSERSAAAYRGQVTKLKKRAANGVCPCCNRTFANLARHMATKHAAFSAEEVSPEGATIQ